MNETKFISTTRNKVYLNPLYYHILKWNIYTYLMWNIQSLLELICCQKTIKWIDVLVSTFYKTPYFVMYNTSVHPILSNKNFFSKYFRKLFSIHKRDVRAISKNCNNNNKKGLVEDSYLSWKHMDLGNKLVWKEEEGKGREGEKGRRKSPGWNERLSAKFSIFFCAIGIPKDPTRI